MFIDVITVKIPFLTPLCGRTHFCSTFRLQFLRSGNFSSEHQLTTLVGWFWTVPFHVPRHEEYELLHFFASYTNFIKMFGFFAVFCMLKFQCFLRKKKVIALYLRIIPFTERSCLFAKSGFMEWNKTIYSTISVFCSFRNDNCLRALKSLTRNELQYQRDRPWHW